MQNQVSAKGADLCETIMCEAKRKWVVRIRGRGTFELCSEDVAVQLSKGEMILSCDRIAE